MNGWEIVSAITNMVTASGAVAAVIVALHMHYRDGLPCIVAHLEHDDDNDAVVLVLANTGSGVAWNVAIDGFKSSMVRDDLLPAVKRSFAFHKIDCLVPGAKLRTIIHMKENISSLADEQCDIKVRYEEKAFIPFCKPRSVSNDFTLSYGNMVGTVYARTNLSNINQSISGAMDCLEKMNEAMTGLACSVNNLTQKSFPRRPETERCQDKAGE